MQRTLSTNEFYFTSADGAARVYVKEWLPKEEPCAILLVAHGMAEHINRYDEFASFLADYGILVVGPDHLGHGKTVRNFDELGFFAEENGWQLLVDNLHILQTMEKEMHPNVPIFLFGQSMGSFLARTYMMDYGDDLAGVILSGTGAVLPPVVHTAQAIAAAERKKFGMMHRSATLDRMGFGSYNKPFAPNRTKFDWLTRDDAAVDAYCADPYCGFTFTVAAFQDLFGGVQRVQNRRNLARVLPTLPILVFSGAEDPVGGNGRGVQKVVHELQDAGLKKVTAKLYAGGRHEMLNELNRGQVYSDVLTWIENRL